MALRTKTRFKADDIWETPDDGNRYEVIDGRLYVSPPPIVPHQNASGEIFGYVWAYLQQTRLGKVFSAPIGVVLDDENGLQPDLVYVSAERLSTISRRGIEGAPDLVMEVLSPSTRSRDLGIKMRRYAAASVPHYWIVDPRSQALRTYRLSEQGYALTGEYGPGSIFRPELFPGLEIPIDALWT